MGDTEHQSCSKTINTSIVACHWFSLFSTGNTIMHLNLLFLQWNKHLDVGNFTSDFSNNTFEEFGGLGKLSF